MSSDEDDRPSKQPRGEPSRHSESKHELCGNKELDEDFAAAHEAYKDLKKVRAIHARHGGHNIARFIFRIFF